MVCKLYFEKTIKIYRKSMTVQGEGTGGFQGQTSIPEWSAPNTFK